MISTIYEKHEALIQYEENDERPPVLDAESIRFNGIGHEAHDTFHWASGKTTFNFCKTAHKDYDIVVCLVLLTLRRQYGEKIELASDGDDEDWQDSFDHFESLFDIEADKTWLKNEE